MSAAAVVGRRKRRRLSPGEKYEIYVSVLTGQATQREAAERYGVDRSTVVTACRVAKQGALDALAAAVPTTTNGGLKKSATPDPSRRNSGHIAVPTTQPSGSGAPA